MKYIIILLCAISSCIAFCLHKYDSCQCFLLLILVMLEVINDINKNDK